MTDLTSPTVSRLVMYPVKHDDIWTLFKKQTELFWTVEEIDFSEDAKDWQKLTPDQRHLISTILGFFVVGDGIVLEHLYSRLYMEVQLPEARAFYSCQGFIETVHSECYSMLVDTYISNPEEKAALFRSIETMLCVQKKANWSLQWIAADDITFGTRLIALAITEGVFFSALFSVIFWFRKQGGLLPALCFSNDLISRDEALHVEAAVLLYSKLPESQRLPTYQVHSMISSAVSIETDFIHAALLNCKLAGMSFESMSLYIRFVSDRLLVQLGYEKLYKVDNNPLDFMNLISLEGKVNFFERKNSMYSLANRSGKETAFDDL